MYVEFKTFNRILKVFRIEVCYNVKYVDTPLSVLANVKVRILAALGEYRLFECKGYTD